MPAQDGMGVLFLRSKAWIQASHSSETHHYRRLGSLVGDIIPIESADISGRGVAGRWLSPYLLLLLMIPLHYLINRLK